MKFITLFLTFLAFSQGAKAQAKSFLYLNSPSGEPIGGGQVMTIPINDSPDSIIYTTPGRGLVFEIRQGSDFFTAQFAPPTGERMKVRSYAPAVRKSEPNFAGLSIAGNGAGCSTSSGQFQVHEFDVTVENNRVTRVNRVAIDFKQRCGISGPYLSGALRYRSDYPTANPIVIAPVPLPATGPTPYMLDIEASQDYLGQGFVGKLIADEDGSFSVRGHPRDGKIEIIFRGDEDWHFSFAAPRGESLKMGRYAGVQRLGYNPVGAAGLDVSVGSRGCNHLTGQFEIKELVMDSQDRIQSFAGSFLQYCDSGAPMKGEIRYNSLIPVR
jgi:hypothetical protein